MEFNYVAVDLSGNKIKGRLTANSEGDLYAKLQNQDLFVLKSSPISSDIFKSSKIRHKDLIIFSKQMASMLGSGISILHAIHILYDKGTSKTLRAFYLELYEKLQGGEQLSKVLSDSQFKIPSFFIYLIQAGEVSGQLETVFNRLAEHYEKEAKLKSSITSALMYPIILLIVAVLVVIAIMVFLLPNFVSQFEGMKLPWNTRLLMAMSNGLIDYWYIHVLVITVVLFTLKQLLKVDKYKAFTDRLKYEFPLLKGYMRVIATTRFTRTFALLYSSGVSVLESLRIIKEIFKNKYLDDKFDYAIYGLKQGETITNVIEQMDLFEPLMYSMLHVGEESGKIDHTLVTTANYFDMELEQATKKVVAVIEPAMILVLAGIVLFIIISVLLPIYGVYSQIS